MPTLRKLIEQSETLAEQNEKMRKAFSGMDVANQISQALEEQRRAILQTANTAAQGFYSMDQALRASIRWQADEEQMRSAMLAMKAAADMPARMISPFDIPAAFEVVNPFALADASLRQQFKDMFAIQPPDMGRFLGGISEANLQAAIKGVAMPAGWDMMLSGIATGFERQPPSMGELLGQVRAPAVIAPRSEPPTHQAQIETVHIALDAREMINHLLSAGKATPKQIIEILLDRNAGSQQPPAWPEIEALALDYERNGHNYDGLAGFARKHGIHRATIDRYLKMYEAATGRQIRPGRGRQKQRKKS